MDLGRVGIWSGQVGLMPAGAVREAVPAIEELGFRCLWFPESVAKEALSLSAILLGAGSELVVAPGIANIWARDATAMANGARTIAEAYPDRFVLGLGVSHAPSVAARGHRYERPLTAMREYLDRMGKASYYGPAPSREPPLVLAALGPKMLRLAADRASGAHSYFIPVSHTSAARSVLGDGPLLAPEQAVVLAADRDKARSIARRYLERYLSIDNYRNNLLRLGWLAGHLAGSGSEEVFDAIVAWGDAEAIRSRVQAHFEAGADHVSVQVLNGPPDEFPLAEFRELAPALLAL